MASILRNGNLYWLKGRHPLTGDTVRFSLATAEAPRANLLLRKWNAWTALFPPEFGDPDFPPKMKECLMALPVGFVSLLPEAQPVCPMIVPSFDSSVISAKRQIEPPLAEVVRGYLQYCRSQNSSHNAANKTSVLKAAFGIEIDKEKEILDGPLSSPRLSQLTAAWVQTFIEGRP